MTQRNTKASLRFRPKGGGILHDEVNAAIIDSESKMYYTVAIVSIFVSSIGMGLLFL